MIIVRKGTLFIFLPFHFISFRFVSFCSVLFVDSKAISENGNEILTINIRGFLTRCPKRKKEKKNKQNKKRKKKKVKRTTHIILSKQAWKRIKARNNFVMNEQKFIEHNGHRGYRYCDEYTAHRTPCNWILNIYKILFVKYIIHNENHLLFFFQTKNRTRGKKQKKKIKEKIRKQNQIYEFVLSIESIWNNRRILYINDKTKMNVKEWKLPNAFDSFETM